MKKNGLSHEEIASLCLELSLLLRAGVASGDALTLLAEESDPGFKEMLSQTADRMDGGAPLSEALRQTGRLPAYVCGLIEVGERSGRLEEIGRAHV